MLQRLKTHQRYYETLFLFLLSCYCFALSLFRLIYSDTLVFIFLNVNLFLAFLPWFFSSLLIIYPKLQQSKIAVTVLLCTWLLFFPNAPYILTDLFHLRHQFSMPVWFDLALILSFAWTGLLFGLLSLWDIEQVLRNFLPPRLIPLVSVSLLFLGSFGIYLGRYLRWNSWDILREPFGILYDISDRLVNPLDHPRTWGMTIIMGLFLNMVYWSFHFIRDRMA